MAYKVSCVIVGDAPLIYGAAITSLKDNETHEAFEHRTWRERCHVDNSENVVYPGYALKAMLVDAAGYLNQKIPGEGQVRYKGKYAAGVRNVDEYYDVLDWNSNKIHIDDVEGVWKHVPSDGRPGGGKRVWKCFPRIEEWQMEISYIVLEQKIEPDHLKHVLITGGLFKGLGTWRPGKNGSYGTFHLVDESFEVEDIV